MFRLPMPPPIRSTSSTDRSPRPVFGRRMPRRRWNRRRLFGLVLRAMLIALLLPVPVIVAYRFVPPPITSLMVIRSLEGASLDRHWVPLERISPALPRAVIASEDE